MAVEHFYYLLKIASNSKTGPCRRIRVETFSGLDRSSQTTPDPKTFSELEGQAAVFPEECSSMKF